MAGLTRNLHRSGGRSSGLVSNDGLLAAKVIGTYGSEVRGVGGLKALIGFESWEERGTQSGIDKDGWRRDLAETKKLVRE
jgi:hypothetical protein